MKKKSETIVFFGSGPVAAASLRLLAQDFSIEAVVTKPRPAHHKGAVPVIDAASELNVPIHTVTNKRTLDDLIASRPFTSRLAILIDFGIIVSQTAIDSFPLGIINSHFSLLPEWRGADPITFSILSGQKQTGVSLMLLTAGMDEGPLLAQAPYNLTTEMTAPSLTQDLIELSNACLIETVPLWFESAIEAMPQEEATIAETKAATYSRKLSKHDSLLDWNKPAEVLEREIRAFIEWPRSRTSFHGLDIVVTRGRVAIISGEPGTREIIDKQPVVYCGKDALVLETVKPAGKKEMTGEAFLAGYKKYFLG